MDNRTVRTVIKIELVCIAFLGLCLLGILGIGLYFRPVPQNMALAEPTRPAERLSPILTPTPEPTSTVIIPTPSPTPTQDPRILLTRCSTIDSPGLYQLAGDIQSTTGGDCIKIQASHVVLDCAGHALEGIAFNGAGIAIRKYGLLGDQSPAAVEVSHCRLNKFRFGIYADGGTLLNIHDNDSSHNFDDVEAGSRYGKFLGMTEGGGIRLNNSSDSIIWNNTTMTQAIGIDVRFSKGITIRDNTSSNNSAWGISVLRTVNSEISKNTAVDNVRQCTWGAGVMGFGCDAGGIILQDGSNGILVSENQVLGRNGNGIFIKAHALPCGSNNTIVGNTITGALYNSIELGFCTGNKVNNNTFSKGLDAVWLGFAYGNEIRDNTITDMKNHGIISSNSHDNIISGNQIINSNVGIYVYSEDVDRNVFGWLPQGDYVSHDNCLCNNRFHANNISIQIKDSKNNRVTNNDLRGNARGIVLQGRTDGNDVQGNLSLLDTLLLILALARQ